MHCTFVVTLLKTNSPALMTTTTAAAARESRRVAGRCGGSPAALRVLSIGLGGRLTGRQAGVISFGVWQCGERRCFISPKSPTLSTVTARRRRRRRRFLSVGAGGENSGATRATRTSHRSSLVNQRASAAIVRRAGAGEDRHHGPVRHGTARPYGTDRHGREPGSQGGRCFDVVIDARLQ